MKGLSITPWLSLVHEHGFLLTTLVGQFAFSVRKCDDTQRVPVPLSHCSIQRGLLFICKNLKILKRLFLKRKSPGLLTNYESETHFQVQSAIANQRGKPELGRAVEQPPWRDSAQQWESSNALIPLPLHFSSISCRVKSLFHIGNFLPRPTCQAVVVS